MAEYAIRLATEDRASRSEAVAEEAKPRIRGVTITLAA